MNIRNVNTMHRLLLPILFLFLNQLAFGQGISVSGKVTDAKTGEAIPMVNVIIKGTTNGVSTQMDGTFSITVPNRSAVLQVSFLGFETFEEAVGDRGTINIRLKEASLGLDELVVVGYGTMKRSDMTGAVSSIATESLAQAAVDNVAKAIQGKAAGVQILQNDGSPGAGIDIKIRGTGTINNSTPLYVVDGIVADEITNINPVDIASMEILKDAAASAVYGARASNGVVLITTKSGSNGKMVINFNSSFSIQDYWNKPDMLDAQSYRVWGLAKNENTNADFDIIRNSLEWDGLKENSIDWLDMISQQGVVQKYNLSVSGGSKGINYYVSAGLFDQDGLIIGSDYKRYSLKSKLSAQLLKDVKLTADAYYVYTEKNGFTANSNGTNSIFKEALSMSPLANFRDPNTGLLTSNPYKTVLDNEDNTISNQIDLKLYLDWNIMDGLKFTTRGGLVNGNAYRSTFNQRNESYDYTYNSDFSDAINSTIYRRSTNTFNWLWENILNYNKSIGLHSIGTTIATSLEGSNNEWFSGASESAYGNDLDQAYLSLGYYSDNTYGMASQYTSVGYIGKVNYSFDSKYLVQANLRVDGSSKFSDGNRWGLFPSFALGWRLSEEDFAKQVDWLSNLKLRTSWGKLGNNRIDDNAIYYPVSSGNNSGYVYGTSDDYEIEQGMYPSSIGNRSIRWEMTETYNFGVDFAVFRGALSGTAEVFHKTTRDMLLRPPIVSSVRATAPMRNTGEVLNQGLEFTLQYSKEVVKDFKISLGGNISFIRNEVLSLGDSDEPVWGVWANPLGYAASKTEVGHPISEFYGFVTDGIYTSQSEIDMSVQPDVPISAFRFKDLNSDGKIDAEDRTYLGSPHPDFMYGFNLNLTYKGFGFTADFWGQYGNDALNWVNYYIKAGNDGSNLKSDYVGVFYNDGILLSDPIYYPVNTSKGAIAVPRSQVSNTKNYRMSDFYIEDASFLRLKNIELSYTFDKTLLEPLKIGSLRLYVSVQNLFTITKYSGLDPEISKRSGSSGNLGLGIDMANYPQARAFMFGLNVNF